ncbi:hypothetical protein GWK08_16480 [Leptobacterium flavescens]|uniref:DUF922 domain-containing protein n=1 Tax=Leptobacterium flavescens TaxID=472055 RepID=A0A6P0UWA5_9FLAO|nr:hypothetical protein [Leptobacterium flavescens]NER15053.1 hypothetical protein [Leptobacterium flavescens]
MQDILIVILFLGLYFSPVLYQLVIVIKENKKGNKTPLKKFKKFLKYSFLILLPLAIAFMILIRVNFLNYESPITYDRVDQITFKNFRGLEFFKKSLYGNKRFAYVVTTIKSEIYDDSVSIQALFHPSRSFVYDTHSNNKQLLDHEIYHFKITELYARKLKYRISNLKHSSKNEIRELISSTWLEERKFQEKYDYDTFHSYVFSEQKKYQKTVDSLLNLLSEFKEPKITLND